MNENTIFDESIAIILVMDDQSDVGVTFGSLFFVIQIHKINLMRGVW